METCTPQKDESNKILNEPMVYPIFIVENITISRPPLLKIYYWESLDIENLNNKLSSQEKCVEHFLEVPARQLNSNALKIVFWLRNLSNNEYIIRLKRIRNCQCMPRQTRVGFNQYRRLYHCPHRRLINISQDTFVMRPDEPVAMTVVSHYFILGTYKLSYELRVSDSRIIKLHFHVNITTFEAFKSVLTTNMTPVNIKEHRSMSQPIWIRNITTQNMSFLFRGKNRDVRLINPNMMIPPQSVWPLIVEYRPSDFENTLQLELFLRYGERAASKCNVGNRYKIPITCKGFIDEEIENFSVPILDNECEDYLYVIYPNRLEFTTEINEEKTLMVAVHNYDEKSMEFKWQTYAINEYFSFTFEPTNFVLKPHHSKLCVVQAKSFNNPLHFKRIPAVLEIHYIQDNSTKIAQQLLSEIESIDDPKWAESSYMGHIFLHLDIKVKFPKLQRINVAKQPDKSIAPDNVDGTTKVTSTFTTIFEELFWEHLSQSNHMRNTSEIPKNLTYKEVLNQELNAKKEKTYSLMNKQETFNVLSFLTAEACRDIAKNYRFVSPEILDRI